MRFLVLTAITVSMITAAHAQSLESMRIATELGTVIASEEVCGLTYNQAAISAYIENKVAADDMGFPSTLQMMVAGTEYQLTSMSGSAKTAHCTQVARAAKSFSFIQ